MLKDRIRMPNARIRIPANALIRTPSNDRIRTLATRTHHAVRKASLRLHSSASNDLLLERGDTPTSLRTAHEMPSSEIVLLPLRRQIHMALEAVEEDTAGMTPSLIGTANTSNKPKAMKKMSRPSSRKSVL
jgi:hypothetical protein